MSGEKVPPEDVCGCRNRRSRSPSPVRFLATRRENYNRKKPKLLKQAILASEKVFLFAPARRAAPARGSAKGTRPFGIPFPPAGGDRCVHRCCHAVPAPPEWWRGGWLTAANLFNREYMSEPAVHAPSIFALHQTQNSSLYSTSPE